MAGMVEGKKTFINKTGQSLIITVYLREGDTPRDGGGTQSFHLHKDSDTTIVYDGYPGPTGYAFINGFMVEIAEPGAVSVGVSKKVVERGTDWDNVLNMHDTITITDFSAGDMAVEGSNS